MGRISEKSKSLVRELIWVICGYRGGGMGSIAEKKEDGVGGGIVHKELRERQDGP